MKKLIILLLTLMVFISVQAQKSPVDEMFDKYSEREGFTVVTISSKMFSMFSGKDDENKKAGDVINRLKSIQILSVEDSTLNKGINFYKELSKKLNMSDYEELMVIKEGPDITKFLIRQNGDVIKELLVIKGGPDGNSLISIKGDLDLKSLSEISKDAGIQELEDLDNIDSKNKK
jgi:glutathione peroxidase-family protein